MDQESYARKAKAFADLHKAGDPLVLFNCWDVATAKASAAAFPAIATSSGAVAYAQGYEDGELIPLDFVLSLTARIATAVDCPVSIDLEAGYSDDPDDVARTVETLIENGIVGINLEDSLSNGQRGLIDPEVHANKIAAIRKTADRVGVPFFINARSDAFLLNIGDPQTCLDETLKREAAYSAAGASGLFVPFLFDLDIIKDIAARISLPLNVLATPKAAPIAALAKAGVSRVSLGGWPFEVAMGSFGAAAGTLAKTREYPSDT